jgi:hypothetical protein
MMVEIERSFPVKGETPICTYTCVNVSAWLANIQLCDLRAMGILSLNGKKLERRQEGRKTTRMKIYMWISRSKNFTKL